jgi:hypothetical protein
MLFREYRKIKNGQSRDTGNIDKQNKNTTQYAQTNNVEVMVFIIILGMQLINCWLHNVQREIFMHIEHEV